MTSAHGDHPPYLAHHFDTPAQQFDAGKFGMWLFLATEVLLFAGLFCAYVVYRSLHPEIFHYGHRYLDVFWGAVNTAVLIFSSLTMAWAVHATGCGQRHLATLMLVITLLCAAGFLVVKYIEYSHKIHAHLLPGIHFMPLEAPPTHGAEEAHAAPAHWQPGEQWIDPDPDRPRKVQVFFSIYFMMTGLHGLHVIAGMCAILWVLWRNLRGDFSAAFNAPVELVGLYWHLVDLIWIYLFPLLYLIA